MDNPEWIKWRGGKCPVPPKTKVVLKFGNGMILESIASMWNWNYPTKQFAIVEYYVVEDEKPCKRIQ